LFPSVYELTETKKVLMCVGVASQVKQFARGLIAIQHLPLIVYGQYWKIQ
jgi:hypothetical protein